MNDLREIEKTFVNAQAFFEPLVVVLECVLLAEVVGDLLTSCQVDEVEEVVRDHVHIRILC